MNANYALIKFEFHFENDTYNELLKYYCIINNNVISIIIIIISVEYFLITLTLFL